MGAITIDRSAQAKDIISEYPAVMREHCEGFYGHAVHAVGRALYCEATTDAHRVRDTFVRMNQDRAARDAYTKAPGMRADQVVNEITGSSNTSFYGMTGRQFADELAGHTHEIQDRFQRACEELERTGIKQALEQGQGFKKRRKRVMSEHDGDYDMEKRWDATPFTTTTLAKKEFPVVELIFPIVNSGGTDHNSISRFGARCLALADLLEKAGYRVAITAENWCETGNPAESFRQAMGKLAGKEEPYIAGYCTRYVIRSANDYGDIQSMALFGSAEFYRRAVFSLDYNACHYIHAMDGPSRAKKVCGGYGAPIYTRPIPCEPGQLFLDQSTMSTLFSSDKVSAQKMFEDRILWELRVKEAKAMGMQQDAS